MFGFYRVAVSFLILVTAIAAKAEINPVLAVMGSGLGVPTPGLGGGSQLGYRGVPGLSDPGPELAPAGSAKEAFERYCNQRCLENRINADAAAYAQRNQQTSASFGGSSAMPGATANISGTGASDASGTSSSGTGSTADVSINGSLPSGQGFAPGRGIASASGGMQCDPSWANMPASALVALESNPATTPDTLAAIRNCLGGGAGTTASVGGGYARDPSLDPMVCVPACMQETMAAYGPKKEEQGPSGQDLMMIVNMMSQESQDSSASPAGYGGYDAGSDPYAGGGAPTADYNAPGGAAPTSNFNPPGVSGF